MRTGSWTAQYTICADTGADLIYSKMPTGSSFLFGSTRHIQIVDLTGMSYVRLKVNKLGTAAPNGSKLILRYSPTFSSTVTSYTDLGISEVSVPIDTTNVYQLSEWIEIDPSARGFGDVYMAVITSNSSSNGNTGPAFGNISVSFC